MEIMCKEISEKLDIEPFLEYSKAFRIADFGCSTGPNSFLAMDIIMEAAKRKFTSNESNPMIPEFCVFFNDHISNDFNTLFRSLPPQRQHHVAAVPGSFHRILFPKHSLHFVYSSCSLNWLSEVPKEVMDKNSPAWNEGKIHYSSSPKEVVEAYSAQFAKDFESFLQARAQELVIGGLMALIIPGILDSVEIGQIRTGLSLEILGLCLVDMANMGIISKQKVDSFNVPTYFPSPKELQAVIQKTGSFSIERMETIESESQFTILDLKGQAHMRATIEGIIEKHFRSDIVDELFVRFSQKVDESFLNPNSKNWSTLFVFLKRKANM